jgi:hypothetical protein
MTGLLPMFVFGATKLRSPLPVHMLLNLFLLMLGY